MIGINEAIQAFLDSQLAPGEEVTLGYYSPIKFCKTGHIETGSVTINKLLVGGWIKHIRTIEFEKVKCEQAANIPLNDPEIEIEIMDGEKLKLRAYVSRVGMSSANTIDFKLIEI